MAKSKKPPPLDPSAGAAPTRGSKRPVPIRRNTIEVQVGWLESLRPPAPPKRARGERTEPVLREEKIVWRIPPAPEVEGEEEETQDEAEDAAEVEPAPAPAPKKPAPPPIPPVPAAPKAAGVRIVRKSRRPAPIPREDPESVPPPRRPSRAPRR